MKRGTVDHPKMLRLAKLLGIERWGAVGIMESLWHFTARHAIQGDIGRWPNEEIAEGIGWLGDPDKLMNALVTSRWIDTCANSRLVIHDWSDHCDDSVRKTLKNRHLSPLSPETSGKFRKSKPGGAKSNGKVPPAITTTISSPGPPPEPEPSQALTTSSPEASSVLMTEFAFPVVGDPERPTWILTSEFYETLKTCYPSLDHNSVMHAALAWCVANPSNRKTHAGMTRFLNGWFERQQNKSRTQQPELPILRKSRVATKEDAIGYTGN